MKPFGVFSDAHLHPWTSFSSDDEHGVNLRLRGLLTEIKRCALEVKDAGGDTIYCAGDVFHTRGKIAPLVLNPTIDTIKEVTGGGIKFRIMSGNHDLERRDSERLSSAITALAMPGVEIVNEPYCFTDDVVAMIPWFDKLPDLQDAIRACPFRGDKDATLILHAPVNGVIAGLPETGLDPEWLASRGFGRVFVGHYHNHKEFPGNVYSIGALANHTWSDVGSKAGFLLVDDEGVHFRKSHLPEFLDLDNLAELDLDQEEIQMAVAGNYVRVKTDETKTSAVESLRQELIAWGALGVLIRSTPKATTTRESAVTASIQSGASIEQSIGDYVKSQKFADPGAVNAGCLDILSRTVA
ncbi:metallophosphoesterase [Castellaniella sp.]|uniref:metallophosphoesterase n=1 Tax=Castellaniella sp. TaxID=1955812 RepID=UPI002AFF9B8E|nr:metallophosphoesterase [Castellaniella sp.]